MESTFFRRVSNTRQRSQHGTALVEAAVVSIAFFVAVFAVFEFGLQFRGRLTVDHAATGGARQAAIYGNEATTDFYVLKTIKHNLTAINMADVNKIVVFKANDIDSKITDPAYAGCLGGSRSNCNHYLPSAFSLDESKFGCGPSSPDRVFCPTTRKVRASDPPDFIGIYVEIQQDGMTGFFTKTRTVSSTVIIRLEPKRA